MPCVHFFPQPHPPKLVPIDAAVILNAVALVPFISHQKLQRFERGRAGETEGGEFISETHCLIPFLGFSAFSLPTASAMRSLTLSRSVLLGKRQSYRERQSLFPVLVNHISVQFPSVLFGNGGMTGVIYHTD